jgi:hypothetical protein
MGEEDKEHQPIQTVEAYESLGVDYLLVFSVESILDNGEECTLERLVFECFTRFPRKFGLSRYPQWPDSTRVYRSWRRCRLDNRWLTGSPQEGFRLTAKGKGVALAVAEKLNDPLLVNRQPRAASKTRGKEEAVTRYLRKSGAFRRWVQNPTSFAISGSEIRSLLNATLETPPDVLRENLAYYQENAKLVGDSRILAFLEACQKQHESIMQMR